MVQRKETTPPMSEGSPTLPNGDRELSVAFNCGLLLMAALLKSVSTGPGATTFAPIPLAPNSFARYLVNTSIAPFIDAYTE